MGYAWDSRTNIVTYPTQTITHAVPAGHHRQHKGLITTNAVKVRRGWLGQVSVDQKIVWETDPQEKREAALELADQRVETVLGRLFAEEP